MRAVILCGGQGSRIRDVSDLVPKPMLMIGDKPILWHIMKGYAAFGINDFILCLGYKGWMIKDFFLNYRAMTDDITLELAKPDQLTYHHKCQELDWRITLAETGEASATGARLYKVKQHIPKSDSAFMFTYGDGVADIDLSALLKHHNESKSAATLTGVRLAGRFGELKLDGSRISSFEEKPATTKGRINGGFMVLDNQRIWDYLEDRSDLIFEREPLEKLARAGELQMYPHNGFWQCMDTPREYTMLNSMWSSGKPPWKTW